MRAEIEMAVDENKKVGKILPKVGNNPISFLSENFSDS